MRFLCSDRQPCRVARDATKVSPIVALSIKKQTTHRRLLRQTREAENTFFKCVPLVLVLASVISANAQTNPPANPTNPCEHATYDGQPVPDPSRRCNVANQEMVCRETANGIFAPEPDPDKKCTGVSTWDDQFAKWKQIINAIQLSAAKAKLLANCPTMAPKIKAFWDTRCPQ